MDPLLVDAEGLAPLLSLSVRTIRVSQAQGVPMVRVGRRVLFDPAAVKDWLARRSAVPARSTLRLPRGRPRRRVL
jgi:phage terminase Nu1 subunit (DNA packaging protein)